MLKKIVYIYKIIRIN